MKLCKLIAVARECKGLELEKRTGVLNSLLSQIENGHVKEPSWCNVVKIAKTFGLYLDRLARCEDGFFRNRKRICHGGFIF